MLARCYDVKAISYLNYGARGIGVCDRWRHGESDETAFECFLKDMGYRPSKSHSLDRIDNNADYDPLNCRWATRREQALNSRKARRVHFNGSEMLLVDALNSIGISRHLFYQRIARGWSEARALQRARSASQ